MIGGFSVLLIILYLLIVLYIGFSASKSENEEGYLLANRDVGLFVLTATLVASIIGGNGMVTMMAFVYEYGISIIWAPIGTLLGFLSLAYFAPKIKKLSDEHRFYTLPDFIHKKYGKAASIPAALIVFVVYIGFILIQFIAGGIVLSAITGWPYTLSVVLMGIVVMTYIFAAGYKAVIKTDIFQYFILFILIVLAFFLFGKVGTIPSSDWNLFAAGAVNITAFILYGLILIVTGADVWQRIYSGKDIKTVKRSLVFSGVLTMVLMVFVILIGLVIKSRFPNIVPETALAVGFIELLPSWLLGFGLVVLFAAIMSSLDTFLFLLSTSVSKDFFSKFERFSKKDFVLQTKWFSLILGILTIILAIFFSSVVSVVTAIAGMYFSLFSVIIFSFKYQLKKGAVVLSIIGGFLASILAFVVMGIVLEAALMSLPASLILLGIGQLVFKK
jgi:solute:Na+ symporter, SSS family